MSSDPYLVLGIPPGATLAEIKRAYRALAKTNHPDSAGEEALPRFLAVQGAYEALLDPRRRAAATTRSRAGAGTPSTGPTAGRTRTGPPPRPGADEAGPSSGARRPDGGAGPRPAGSRRRATRRATPGSTTYGAANDAEEATWHGSSWYGQTSGEYWRVNPREYADPRKHGPEYQARTAGGRQRNAGAQGAARPSQAGTDQPGPATARPGPAGTGSNPAAERTGRPSGPRRATADPATAGAAQGATQGAAAGGATAGSFDGWSAGARLLDRTGLGRLLHNRFVLALVAWPPLGIAIAALIGQLTGCATFAASCPSGAEAYPWLAQGLILGTLIALPGVARPLVGGSVAVVILAFPITAALSAGGATYDRTNGPASLLGLLGLAWACGVLVALGRRAGFRILAR